jgi:hypothetical protein
MRFRADGDVGISELIEYNTAGNSVGSSSKTYTNDIPIDMIMSTFGISLDDRGAFKNNWEFKNVTITITYY